MNLVDSRSQPIILAKCYQTEMYWKILRITTAYQPVDLSPQEISPFTRLMTVTSQSGRKICRWSCDANPSVCLAKHQVSLLGYTRVQDTKICINHDIYRDVFWNLHCTLCFSMYYNYTIFTGYIYIYSMSSFLVPYIFSMIPKVGSILERF